MGQILSIIWNWVCSPKEESKGRFENLLSANNEEPSEHCIDILEASSVAAVDHPQEENSDKIVQVLIFDPLPDPAGVDLRVDEAVVEDEDEESSDKIVQVVKEISRARKSIGGYNSSQRILLVGEGDFSFSACLALAFGSASNVTATSLNSIEFLVKNYGSFPNNQLELQTRGSVVLHGVDATNMARHPHLFKLTFDRIIYNFPHAGFKQESPEAQIKRHQKLVRGFLRNAKKMIEEDGQIHITHKSNPFFLKWDIPNLGSDQGLHLIQQVKFKRSKYPGYHTKYGFGGDKDFDCNPSKTYKFKLA